MAQMTAFQAAICGHDISLYASADSPIVAYTAEVAQHLGLAAEIDRAGHSIRLRTADGKTGRVTLRTTGHRVICTQAAPFATANSPIC